MDPARLSVRLECGDTAITGPLLERERVRTLQSTLVSDRIFAFFVAFCSFLFSVARRQQVAEEMAGQKENDAGCAA
jgi:hypothetical protein